MENKIGDPEWSSSKKSFYRASNEKELIKKYLYEKVKERRCVNCSAKNKT